MKVLAGIALLGLYLVNIAEASAYEYLVSSTELKHRNIKTFCKRQGGYAAVLDYEDLDRIPTSLLEGLTEAYIGKNLEKKGRIWKIKINKEGEAVMKRSSGKRKLPVICQQEGSEESDSDYKSKSLRSRKRSKHSKHSKRSKHSRRSKSKRGSYVY